ncbi:MAG: hypothetical protein JSV68_01955 [Anaerolineaceae bacterium]|nr:MAG: hypothetical protein JSV68_01955 [Anaerolineaceae bacterium]
MTIVDPLQNHYRLPLAPSAIFAESATLMTKKSITSNTGSMLNLTKHQPRYRSAPCLLLRDVSQILDRIQSDYDVVLAKMEPAFRLEKEVKVYTTTRLQKLVVRSYF